MSAVLFGQFHLNFTETYECNELFAFSSGFSPAAASSSSSDYYTQVKQKTTDKYMVFPNVRRRRGRHLSEGDEGCLLVSWLEMVGNNNKKLKALN